MKGIIKYCVVYALSILLIWNNGLSGIEMSDKYVLNKQEKEEKIKEDDLKEDIDDEEQDDKTEKEVVYYLYEQLNDEEKEIYNQFVKEIPTYCKEFMFIDTEADMVWNVLEVVLIDHPEFFWLAGGGEVYIESENGKNTVTITPIYYGDEAVNRERSKEIEDVVEKLVSEANAFSTEYEKVLFVHDYMVDNMTYNHEEATLIESGDEGFHVSSTSYGSLVNNNPVCSGYSAGFQLVMQRLGIGCGRINGNVDGGLHQWNYLDLDGAFYYMDVTWDDPSFENGQEYKTYNYFCVDEASLKKTHEIEWEYEIPECVAEKYNYFVYNGFMLDTYEFNGFSDVISKQISNGIAYVRFRSESEYNKAINDLYTNNRINDIESISKLDGWSYLNDDERLIMMIICKN